MFHGQYQSDLWGGPTVAVCLVSFVASPAAVVLQVMRRTLSVYPPNLTVGHVALTRPLNNNPKRCFP